MPEKNTDACHLESWALQTCHNREGQHHNWTVQFESGGVITCGRKTGKILNWDYDRGGTACIIEILHLHMQSEQKQDWRLAATQADSNIIHTKWLRFNSVFIFHFSLGWFQKFVFSKVTIPKSVRRTNWAYLHI